MLEQLLLQTDAERRTSGEQHGQGLEVVGRRLQLVEQRPGERVADDQQEVESFTFDEAPDVGRIEPIGDRLHEHGAAEVPRAKAHPVPSTMHQRRGDQRLHPTGGIGNDALDRLRSGSTEACDVGVAVAPQNTFRHAGGAAGVEDVEIVGAPLDIGPRGGGSGERILVPDRTGKQLVA